MTSDARISVSFASHPKTKKVIRRLGEAGAWHVVCLILWAAANRPDGSLAGMSDEDVELAVDWRGLPGEFVATLASVAFIDGTERAYVIHDWAEHNPWVNGQDMRSAKARWNAVKRHHGVREADRQVPEYAARNASSTEDCASSNATSNASSTVVAMLEPRRSNAPSPSPSPSEELLPSSLRSDSSPDGDLLGGKAMPKASAERFHEFWTLYPNKTGRKPCEAKWRARRLDAKADEIIADVRRKLVEDDRWVNGYVPNPETYINQDRWTDPVQPRKTNVTRTMPSEDRPRTARRLGSDQ
jgi:hypothetical protein